MKKYGKITALIAGVVLALGFASCKADTDDDDDTSQPPAYYTVTFNSNGGTEVTSQKVESGKKATKPANPTKQAIATETYAFENWYTSTDNGTTLSDTAFDFNTPITKDITLYAKWAANAVTHTVSFDTNGGSDVASQTIVHGNKAAKPTNPTKAATEAETYAFDNWYTSTDGGTTLSDTAFDFDTAITKDITLYAKWTVNAVTHTVTFDTNGGSTVESQTIVHGNKATKPADPTKRETATEAFAFDNWYSSTDNGATLSDTAFDFNTAVKADITLYAKWNVYTIEYIELKDCSAIRTMFETLCEYSNYKFQKTITRFAKADARPEAAENYIDAAGNQIPLWYDEGKTTLYYYLEPGKKMTLMTSDGKNSLFSNMSDAVYIETGDFDTSNVTNMGSMFSVCKALTSLDVSKFDTSNVTDMWWMFYGCKALTSLDVSKFDTSNVTRMYYMFSDCEALTSLDVSKFDTSKVTNMSCMFSGCKALTSLDVSKFDTSNVTNMNCMFYNCKALITITASEKFVTNKVTYSSKMFYNCTSLKGGAGTVHDASHTDKEYARIDGGTEEPGYFTKKQ